MSQPPRVLRALEIVAPGGGGASHSVEAECPTRVTALIARAPLEKPSRDYQQTACAFLLHRLLDAGPFVAAYRAGRNWRLARAASGAPRLIQNEGPSRFNVSIAHSGDWFAVALAKGARVGVDIERIKPRKNLRAMAEYMAWSGEVSNLDDFLARWTLWEACVKLEESSIFARGNAAFEALRKAAQGRSLMSVDRWTALRTRESRGAQFALALECEGREPLELRALQLNVGAAGQSTTGVGHF
jgi:hypothetical protein